MPEIEINVKTKVFSCLTIPLPFPLLFKKKKYFSLISTKHLSS